VARVIGLTGGIGSGKSTVAAMLAELGAPVVDADQVARAVVEPGTPGLAAVIERFGDGVVRADGTLDRARLGEIVFGDNDARADLNAILHPRIAFESQRRIRELADGGAPVVVYEAALIVENQLHRGFDGLIVVSVAPDRQRERVASRDGSTLEQADARIAAQLPLADKVAVADWVIDNGGTIEQTRARVAEVWAQVTGSSEPPSADSSDSGGDSR